MLRIPVLLLALCTLAACPAPELVTDLPNLPGGNPLVPEVAMYPFPSDLYLVDDDTTETGRRVSIPDEALPPNLLSSMYDEHDGFSRIPALLTWFPDGVDPASLPDAADPSATTSSGSPILLVEQGTGRLIPLLAELDANARGPFEQALILRPHHALHPDTGYAVLIRDTLQAADGGAITPTAAFVALRDDLPTDSDELERQRPDFQRVLLAADELGIDRASLIGGWTFHTRSASQVTGPLLAMQDVMANYDIPAWTPVSEGPQGDDQVIEGNFTVPWFLDDDNRIRFDPSGAPIQQGFAQIGFVLAIPDTITEGPRPLVCFGHGFFSGKEEIVGGSFNNGLHTWQVSAAAIDFRGFAEIDVLDTFPILAGELHRTAEIVDRQVQNVANFTALARLVREQLAPEVQIDTGGGPFAPIDADAVHYMGISNGGTQGLTIMSTSPQFERGVLVVPGGGWTHMLQRAVQWNEFAGVLEEQYDTPLDLQLTMSLLQPVFDPADSLNYVDRLLQDRADGRADVSVTLHQAVGDSQVANLVTDWVARTADVPLVVPSPRTIWGLDPVQAPDPDGYAGSAAMFVYDENLPPPPSGNVPPETDNGGHGSLRSLPAYLDQVGAYLETGAIVQVCDGACDPQ